MRTTIERWAAFVILLACIGGLVPALAGCDRGCDAYATCFPEDWLADPPIAACPEDPADGPVAEHCGVWVSSTLGQDSGPGTQEAPVQTLAKAIALAQAGSGRIYACGETYAEPVSLPSGISLFGGFDCGHDWAYTGLSHRARIVPAPGFIALTFLEGDEPSMIGDIEARSADAVEPGASSIAVLILDQTRGVLRRADIFAGNGADGQDGADGDHNGFPAKEGVWGKGGADACTADAGMGGDFVALDCGDGSSSTGGAGGDGTEQLAGNGADGLPVVEQDEYGYGAGGKGESAAPTCTGGQSGMQGASGEHGTPDANNGEITREGQVLGGDGGDGTAGLPGQGGGGGGASLGKASCGVGSPTGGAGGGSGGSGGCGGRSGKGGQAGGSSIGIAARGSQVDVTDVRIFPGNGGNGGKGGTLQAGGQGGLPGAGGQAFGDGGGVKSGCPGGAGGNGGNGGHGAGGRGGHSTAVALVGIPNLTLDGASVPAAGNRGAGGEGGGPLAAVAGKDGTAAPYLTFDP